MGPPVSTAAPSATSSHPFLLHMSRTYIQSSYHQLSPLSTEMLKVLIPVPVPYAAVLTVMSSVTQRTEEQQGKRISNEDPYLPEKRTTSTTFLAQFSASKRPKSWSGRKKKYPRSQRQWDNCKFWSWLCILLGNQRVQSNSISNLCQAHIRLSNRRGPSYCIEQTDLLVSTQPAHTATSEPVPELGIPSSMRIPLKIKPYFLHPLKNLPVVEKEMRRR